MMTPGQIASIGEQLKRLRRDNGYSLQALSKRAGVSIGLLSQIERGLASPTLRTLSKIQTALNVSFSTLFEPPAVSMDKDSRYVQRHETRRKVDLGPGRLIKEFLSPFASDTLQCMILDIPPNGSSGEPYSYMGEKAGLVLRGELELTINDVSTTLREGDSFQFDSTLLHSFKNRTNMLTQVVWIIRKDAVSSGL